MRYPGRSTTEGADELGLAIAISGRQDLPSPSPAGSFTDLGRVRCVAGWPASSQAGLRACSAYLIEPTSCGGTGRTGRTENLGSADTIFPDSCRQCHTRATDQDTHS